LAGSWLFAFDNLSGIGKLVGFNYYNLLEKMFLVEYDDVYCQTLWMYGIFILLFQIFIWIGLKRIVQSKLRLIEGEKPVVSSSAVSIMALFFLSISVFLVKDVIVYSLILNESVYINIRSAPFKGYVIHQYACWFMVVSLFIYLGLSLRKQSSWIELKKQSGFYWFVFILCNAYLIFIGSRHEVFFGGIVVLVLMSYPIRSIWESRKSYFVVVSIWLFILMLNDPFRSLTPVISRQIGFTQIFNSVENQTEASLFQQDRTFISHKSPRVTEEIKNSNALKDTVIYLKNDSIIINRSDFFKQTEEHPDYILVGNQKIKIESHISLVYQNNSVLTKLSLSLANMIFSNELFAGHFSMYGVLKKNVQPSCGISIKNLIYSFIPSAFVKQRPEDAYTYYSHQMKFRGTQGFTINYITAWYLNFSYLGLLLGPFFIAAILLLPFYLLRKLSSNKGRLFSVIAICGITGFAAMTVRSGPESTKALLYEGVLIPIFAVAIGVMITRFLKELKSRIWKVKK
jgi:hypothetical protein